MRALAHPARLAAGKLMIDADARSFGAQDASGRPSTSAAQAVISETTKPACRPRRSRRNGASVTPDIGARTTWFGSVTAPIATGRVGKIISFNSHLCSLHRIRRQLIFA